MPAVGINRVRRNLRIKTEQIKGPLTEQALVAIAMEGAAESAKITPVDTGTLINSLMQVPQIIALRTGMQAKIGYTASYAAAVHGMSGKLKGQPRADFGMTSNRSKFGPQKPTAFGGGTGKGVYWGPNGEPLFLTKGFERVLPDIPAILKAIYGT